MCGIKPPEITVILSNVGWRSRGADPSLRDDLLTLPSAPTQKQITKSGLVASTDPKAPTPACAAADRRHGLTINDYGRIVVAMITPGVRGADAIHDFVFEHAWQWLLPHIEEREGKAIDAHVVVFPFSPWFLNRARLALASTEFLCAKEVALLVPHRTFPLARLLQMFFPGNLCVMHCVVAIAHIFLHRVLNA